MTKLIKLYLKIYSWSHSHHLFYTHLYFFFEFPSDKIKKIKEANPDGNFFRITYPNYSQLNKDYAYKKI